MTTISTMYWCIEHRCIKPLPFGSAGLRDPRIRKKVGPRIWCMLMAVGVRIDAKQIIVIACHLGQGKNG
jgi:hypothetical protein